MQLRTLGQSVSLDHDWYSMDKLMASGNFGPCLPEEGSGPVVQPGSMLGLSLDFGEEIYCEDHSRLFHVSKRKRLKGLGWLALRPRRTFRGPVGHPA